jgi:hypothetical protein
MGELEEISSKWLSRRLIGYGRFKAKIALRQKKWLVKCHINLRIIFKTASFTKKHGGICSHPKLAHSRSG